MIEQLAKLPGPFDRPDLGPLIVSKKVGARMGRWSGTPAFRQQEDDQDCGEVGHEQQA